MNSGLIVVMLVLLAGLAAALGTIALILHRRRALDLRFQQVVAALQTAEDERRRVVERFRPVLDLDAEVARVGIEIARVSTEHAALVARAHQERQAVAADYQRVKSVYDRLTREVALIEENLEDISFGLYRPHFDFEASDEYRRRLEHVRDAKKQMVRDGLAAQGLVAWTVGGSRREGERMQKQLSKLMLRAFNGECDAAVANVSWNNVTRMEERIRRSFDAINQLGTVVQVSMMPGYLALGLEELRLEFELEEKRREEAEEQRRIKEQMREEERAQRELERAQEDAEDEERRYEKALAKARTEVAKAKGAQLVELGERIKALEAELAAAHVKRERALSMAQQTRRGHVYVISNIGSFGEEVLKIGMTRRLEPQDRVRELGDASVPFEFDVHAMVYTEDAPALETALHGFFDSRRVNRVNPRKEFFRVGLHEIEKFLIDHGHTAQLTKLATAREYRETLAMLAKQSPPIRSDEADAFPDELT